MIILNSNIQGRRQYFEECLQKSHELVCPQEMYADDATAGLRDVLLKTVKLLKDVSSFVFKYTYCKVPNNRGVKFSLYSQFPDRE